MTTETVLTDEDLVRILKFGASSITMGRAIEQAVLQSTQLQQRMNAYATAKVREALEEAALLVNRNSDQCSSLVGKVLLSSNADAIRALIPK